MRGVSCPGEVSIRLLTGTFLPPLAGVVGLLAMSWPANPDPVRLLRGVLEALAAAGLVMGLQSLAYAVIMESVVFRLLRGLVGVMVFSGFLGMAAGYSLHILTGSRGDMQFVGLGLAVGLFVGCVLWALRRVEGKNDEETRRAAWKPYALALGACLAVMTATIILAVFFNASWHTRWLTGLPGVTAGLAVLAVAVRRLWRSAAEVPGRGSAVGQGMVMAIAIVFLAANIRPGGEPGQVSFSANGEFVPALDWGC